jgi:bifunctional non-homologous end joining protein LigD
MNQLPLAIPPMLATLHQRLPPDAGRFGWELKWDGVRAIAYVEAGALRLVSRNDIDMARTYPELAVLVRMVREPMILDGEIVALRAGRPDFALLQNRMHVQRPSDRLVRTVPVQFYLFDILHRGDRSLLTEPYTARRAELEGLGLDEGPVRTPPYWPGDAEAVLAASRAQGLEGVVGKPLNSPYSPGRRGPWIKVKNVLDQEVIIVGWLPGEGRSGMIGSLALAVHEHGLRYVGNVGTGFTHAALRELARRLRPIERPDSPVDTSVPAAVARRVRWVEPRVVGEVAHAGWTEDGHLRQSSWRGLRPDKHPAQVKRDLSHHTLPT